MDLLERFSDVQTCVRIVSILFGLSLAVTFAEKLLYAKDFGSGGWFPWRIFRFDRSHLRAFRSFPRLTEVMFGRLGMTVVLITGLVGVVSMWFAAVRTPLFAGGVSLTVLACLMIHFRSIYGGDGSQQMNLIIGVALLLGFNPWVRPVVGVISLMFIAAQSCLAYLTSGVSKLVSPIWMRGDPLVGIFATKAYGSPFGLQLVLRLRGLRPVVGITMVFVESLFPISLLLPKPLFLAFLFWGVVFHISNAVFMGLNTFLWSFLATYPALCYAWLLIHKP